MALWRHLDPQNSILGILLQVSAFHSTITWNPLPKKPWWNFFIILRRVIWNQFFPKTFHHSDIIFFPKTALFMDFQKILSDFGLGICHHKTLREIIKYPKTLHHFGCMTSLWPPPPKTLSILDTIFCRVQPFYQLRKWKLPHTKIDPFGPMTSSFPPQDRTFWTLWQYFLRFQPFTKL